MMLWKFFFFSFAAVAVHAANLSNATAYRSVAYYVDWAIYARSFYPRDLPIESLTHVLYAFANIDSNTGQVFLADTYADTNYHFPSDPPDDTGTNLYGCLKQLYLLKKQNRSLKVLLSIGGWTYSPNFAQPVSTSAGRLMFAASAVALVRDLGLDGVDVDWEYPENNDQATNMVLLLQAIRQELDKYGQSLSSPYPFQLSVASPAGPSNYQKLHLAEMDQYVDFWNLIAYDYAGNWSAFASNQANLFLSQENPASTPFDTFTAVKYYKAKGVNASKIVLGMPLYGRSFMNTEGLGKSFNSVGQGSWDQGVYDYKSLPLSGATEFYDNATGSSYSYDAPKKELISYDNTAAATEKAAFIAWSTLGGAMWWESSADRTGNMSLIKTVVGVLGGSSVLEGASNRLDFPDSIYDNLRAGMPDPGPNLSPRNADSPHWTTVTLTSTITECGVNVSTFASTFPETTPPSLASKSSTTHSTMSPSVSTSYYSTSATHSTSSATISTSSYSTSATHSTSSVAVSMSSSTSATHSTTISTSSSSTSTSQSTSSTTATRSTSPTTTSISSSTSATHSTSSLTMSMSSSSTYSTSSTAVSTSSSTSVTHSTTISTSSSSTSTTRSTSSATVSSEGSGCTTSNTCITYNCVHCPNGACFCGLDANHNPTCFQNAGCANTCSTNDDCGTMEGCVLDSCCRNGGYCIPLAKDPSWCGKGVEKRVQGTYQGSTLRGSNSCFRINIDGYKRA